MDEEWRKEYIWVDWGACCNPLTKPRQCKEQSLNCSWQTWPVICLTVEQERTTAHPVICAGETCACHENVLSCPWPLDFLLPGLLHLPSLNLTLFPRGFSGCSNVTLVSMASVHRQHLKGWVEKEIRGLHLFSILTETKIYSQVCLIDAIPSMLKTLNLESVHNLDIFGQLSGF